MAPPAPGTAAAAMLSGVRIAGCLTMVLAIVVGAASFVAIGPLGLLLGGGIGVIGFCMALVTSVK